MQQVTEAEAPAVRTQRRRYLQVLRLMLALAWLVVLVGTALVGERPSSLQALERGIAAGDVQTVRMTDGLPADARGKRYVELHWRDGLLRHVTRVVETARPERSSGAEPQDRSEVAVPVTATVAPGLRDRLTALRPGLEVERTEFATYGRTVLGWRLDSWVGDLVVIAGICTALLLFGSPQPWRATRWAWFWLLAAVPLIGVPAYLLLSGPAPGLRDPRDLARRMTGGYGFLLAVLLSLAVGLLGG